VMVLVLRVRSVALILTVHLKKAVIMMANVLKLTFVNTTNYSVRVSVNV